jgi:divalent metal cation (Fe/Co/Zn/Cd) transporter
MGYHDIAKYSDPVMALVLAAILLAPPITLLRDSVRELLDANPGESVEKPVRALVQEFCKKYDLPAVRRIRCRKAGRRVFVDLSFASDQFRTVAQAHLIRQEFHKRAQEALGSSDVIICFETADTPDSGA